MRVPFLRISLVVTVAFGTMAVTSRAMATAYNQNQFRIRDFLRLDKALDRVEEDGHTNPTQSDRTSFSMWNASATRASEWTAYPMESSRRKKAVSITRRMVIREDLESAIRMEVEVEENVSGVEEEEKLSIAYEAITVTRPVSCESRSLAPLAGDDAGRHRPLLVRGQGKAFPART
ncbi:hypothetical protein KC349_g80 [Hortaea werneckii]|nr:hypothetical protein KC349_g80 [Hortaea werneckii]